MFRIEYLEGLGRKSREKDLPTLGYRVQGFELRLILLFLRGPK